MAKVSFEIVSILRNTAQRISSSKDYQWGHMGACNCGFLAQEVTQLRKAEIHQRAMHGHGDWNEQLNGYCPTSGLPMDDLIANLLAAGFDIDDLKHLERLSDSEILRAVPLEKRNLRQNVKADVLLYINTWAAVIEQKLMDKIKLPEEILTDQEVMAV